jgi:S-formylglutathione hydrolase
MGEPHAFLEITFSAICTCRTDLGGGGSYSAQKGGFLRDAAAAGIAILFPDTSPRGAGVEGEDADWDFGTGEHTLFVLFTSRTV